MVRKSKPIKITDRMWEDLHKKLDCLTKQLIRIQDDLPNKPKRYLKFNECIPPTEVCRSVVSMMNGVENYNGFIGKLSEYYGCSIMGIYVGLERVLALERQTGKSYVAFYDSNLKAAYSKEKTVSQSTVLHEWFHHMHAQGVVSINVKDEEYYAARYAEVFLQRANMI